MNTGCTTDRLRIDVYGGKLCSGREDSGPLSRTIPSRQLVEAIGGMISDAGEHFSRCRQGANFIQGRHLHPPAHRQCALGGHCCDLPTSPVSLLADAAVASPSPADRLSDVAQSAPFSKNGRYVDMLTPCPRFALKWTRLLDERAFEPARLMTS